MAQIYRILANRDFCKINGIFISVPKLSRPVKDTGKTDRKTEYKYAADRMEVERFFSSEKRFNGVALIMTKLKETSLVSIALPVFITTLFAISVAPVFLDCDEL